MPRDLFIHKLGRKWRLPAMALERTPLPKGSARKEIMTSSMMIDHYAVVAGDELERMLSDNGLTKLAAELHSANGGAFTCDDVMIFEWEAWESGMG